MISEDCMWLTGITPAGKTSAHIMKLPECAAMRLCISLHAIYFSFIYIYVI